MRRLRPALSVLTALVVLTGTLGALVIQGAFAFQREHAAEHLCENRHDPGSDCQGSCVLAKRLAEHHGHDTPDAPATVPAPPTLHAVAIAENGVPPLGWREASAGVGNGGTAERAGHADGVFRPPRQS